jgi:hypothetical protein
MPYQQGHDEFVDAIGVIYCVDQVQLASARETIAGNR